MMLAIVVHRFLPVPLPAAFAARRARVRWSCLKGCAVFAIVLPAGV